ARLLGALDAVLDATGLGILDPATRRARCRCEETLRARCGPRKLERARAAGRETPLGRLRRDLERLVRPRCGEPAASPSPLFSARSIRVARARRSARRSWRGGRSGSARERERELRRARPRPPKARPSCSRASITWERSLRFHRNVTDPSLLAFLRFRS